MFKNIGRIFFVLSVIASLILCALFVLNGILPFKYRLALIGILILFEVILLILLERESTGALVAMIILAIFSIGINSFASYYIYTGVSAIDRINDRQKTDELNFSLLVLKESSYEDISDIEEVSIETALSQDEDNISLIKKAFEEKEGIDLNLLDSNSYINAANDLMDKSIEVILLNESYRSSINEQIKDFDEKTRILASISKNVDVEDFSKEVEKNGAFNVYISGIDTYGELSTVSRSDVNLMLTVNPKTKKILITDIPRDSYVEIAGAGLDQYDKLTHAGMYGVESSVKTLENLFDTDINYYAKVNFSTFIDVIDVLDGIDIYNDQYFYSDYYEFPVGDIHLDGEAALTFSRERYQLANGDLDRGKNQEKVLKAIIEKFLSPSILINYNSFLDLLMESTDTNMSYSKIIELINDQIDYAGPWQIDTSQVEGYGQSGLPSFAMPGADLYMYVLDEESLEDVSNQIETIMNEK